MDIDSYASYYLNKEVLSLAKMSIIIIHYYILYMSFYYIIFIPFYYVSLKRNKK